MPRKTKEQLRVDANIRALAEMLTPEEAKTLLDDLLQKRRDAAKAEREAKRQQAAERISDILSTVENLLREAGDLAESYEIPFTFVTPKGNAETHTSWTESACYPSDGWYYEDGYYQRQHSKVHETQNDNDWQSSSQNC